MREFILIAELWFFVIVVAIIVRIGPRRLKKENGHLEKIILSDRKSDFLDQLGDFLMTQQGRNAIMKHDIDDGRDISDIERFNYYHYYYLTKQKTNEMNNARIAKWVVPLMYLLLLFPFLYFIHGISAKTILFVVNFLICICIVIVLNKLVINNNKGMTMERTRLLEIIDERFADMVERN